MKGVVSSEAAPFCRGRMSGMGYRIFDKPSDEITEFEELKAQLKKVKDFLDENPNQVFAIAAAHTYEEVAYIQNGPWTKSGEATKSRLELYTTPSEDGGWVLFAESRAMDKSEAKKWFNEANDKQKELCDVIAMGAEHNGYKVTSRYSKVALQSARLVFDRAAELGKDDESVINLAKWSLAHDFWSQNIRSVSKFYKQYDRLREQANKEARGSEWQRKRKQTEDIWDAIGEKPDTGDEDIWGEGE